MKSSLLINNIEVSYDASPVLSGVTFEVRRGEFVGIIGPNGCGKTTLLRTISRVLKPHKGAVLIDDADVFGVSGREFAREVAHVPQDAEAVFDYSVLEVVLMGRSPHLSRFQMEGAEDIAIAYEAMRQTHTLHLAERPASALSGGELQRVIIARGLAQQPQIILLDEPTSHLDLSFQFEVLDLIMRLNREESLTVIAVLHDLNLAAHYCDRLILLGSGTIQAMGSPEDVVTAHNIKKVYGAEVWVRKHPTSGRPYVIAGVGRKLAANGGLMEPRRVHIICGGGTGAPIMAKLVKQGYTVSAGVLNQGDTDLEVAESLGIETSTCPPFTALTSEAEETNQSLIEKADAVVLSDIPIGQWNLPNLDAAKKALESGVPLILLRPESVSSRDFTGGKASETVNQLLDKGAVAAENLDELVVKMEEITG